MSDRASVPKGEKTIVTRRPSSGPIAMKRERLSARDVSVRCCVLETEAIANVNKVDPVYLQVGQPLSLIPHDLHEYLYPSK